MGDKKHETQVYTSSGQHLVIDGAGDVWPDTEANRKAKRRTLCALTEAEAKRYGDALVKSTRSEVTKVAAPTDTK